MIDRGMAMSGGTHLVHPLTGSQLAVSRSVGDCAFKSVFRSTGNGYSTQSLSSMDSSDNESEHRLKLTGHQYLGVSGLVTAVMQVNAMLMTSGYTYKIVVGSDGVLEGNGVTERWLQLLRASRSACQQIY